MNDKIVICYACQCGVLCVDKHFMLCYNVREFLNRSGL